MTDYRFIHAEARCKGVVLAIRFFFFCNAAITLGALIAFVLKEGGQMKRFQANYSVLIEKISLHRYNPRQRWLLWQQKTSCEP